MKKFEVTIVHYKFIDIGKIERKEYTYIEYASTIEFVYQKIEKLILALTEKKLKKNGMDFENKNEIYRYYVKQL